MTLKLNKFDLSRITTFFKEKKLYFVAFIVPALIMYGAYVLFKVYPFGDGSALVLDLNAQYIQYYEGLKDAIFSDGSIFYSWSRNLSGEFMGIIGYYLASPFSIIPMLFPRELMVDSIMFMQLCKVGACGVTFLIYLNKKKDIGFSAVIFSVMYALMSYSVVEAMNPMWIDGLVFLPLIILGIERLVDNNKLIGLIIPLAMMFFANFYIGYMIGIFSIIYFFCYCYVADSYKDMSNFLAKLIRFCISGITSLAIAAPMLLPVYFSLKQGKMDFSDPSYAITEKFNLFQFFAKLLPESYDSVNVKGLPFVYCGVLALLLLPMYFLNKRISKRSKLGNGVMLIVVFLCMYVSIFDLALHGFQWPNWLNYRYSFVFSFFMLALSYRAFKNTEGFELKQLYVTAAIIGVVVLFIQNQNYSFIVTTEAIWLTIILLTSYCALMALVKKQNYKPVALVLLLIVGAEMLVNTVDSFEKIDDEVTYSTRNSYVGYIEENQPVVDAVKNSDDSFYRMEKLFHRTVNDPIMLDFYGISHSSSTLNSRPIDLIGKLGYTSRGHFTKYNGGTLVSDSLLGIKYILSNTRAPAFLSESFTMNNVSVYENPYALDIAFIADKAILDVELDEKNPFEAQNKLLNGLLGTQNVRFFEKVEISSTQYVNVNEIDAIDQMRYVPIVSGENAHIEYSFVVPDDKPLYLFMPTKYERKVSLWIDSEWLGQYYEGDDYVVKYIGSKAPNEAHVLKVSLSSDELFMQDRLIYSFDMDAFEAAINQIRSVDSQLEKKSATKLVVTSSSTKDSVLFTSIPYEKGWSVKIDGTSADVLAVADSLLAVEVPAGTHTIVLRFFPQGLAIGLILWVVGVAFVVFIYISQRKKKLESNKSV